MGIESEKGKIMTRMKIHYIGLPKGGKSDEI